MIKQIKMVFLPGNVLFCTSVTFCLVMPFNERPMSMDELDSISAELSAWTAPIGQVKISAMSATGNAHVVTGVFAVLCSKRILKTQFNVFHMKRHMQSIILPVWAAASWLVVVMMMSQNR